LASFFPEPWSLVKGATKLIQGQGSRRLYEIKKEGVEIRETVFEVSDPGPMRTTDAEFKTNVVAASKPEDIKRTKGRLPRLNPTLSTPRTVKPDS
jgi:hypothetical protein